MQVLILKRRSLWGWTVLAAMFMLATGQVQAVQWQNDAPWWTYEDSTPVIPADVRLKIHNISQTWSQAYDYHNRRFRPVYDQREGKNIAFATQWNLGFVPYWIAFSETLRGYISSKLQVESRTAVPGTTIDVDHVAKMAKTRMVTAALVEKARVLTLYLEDDTVRARWEIFTQRLITLEDTIKELH